MFAQAVQQFNATVRYDVCGADGQTVFGREVEGLRGGGDVPHVDAVESKLSEPGFCKALLPIP